MLSPSEIHHPALDFPSHSAEPTTVSTLTPLYTPPDHLPSCDYFAATAAAGTTVRPAPVMPQHPKRPQTQPVQDVFDLSDEPTSSDDSVSTVSSMDSSDAAPPPLDFLRCSRCHNHSNRGAIDLANGNMVSYGLNLYYCRRCANVVGYSGSRLR